MKKDQKEEKSTLSIANVSQKELDRFSDVLTEIVGFWAVIGEYNFHNIYADHEKILGDDFTIINNIIREYDIEYEGIEGFLEEICKLVCDINHPKICLILDTLIDNCTDKDSDVIDFKPEIKKALELQEGVNMKKIGNFIWICGDCKKTINVSDNYCSLCGMKVLRGGAEND